MTTMTMTATTTPKATRTTTAKMLLFGVYNLRLLAGAVHQALRLRGAACVAMRVRPCEGSPYLWV